MPVKPNLACATILLDGDPLTPAQEYPHENETYIIAENDREFTIEVEDLRPPKTRRNDADKTRSDGEPWWHHFAAYFEIDGEPIMGGKKIKMGGKRVCWCEEVQISESEVRRRRWKFRGVVFSDDSTANLDIHTVQNVGTIRILLVRRRNTGASAPAKITTPTPCIDPLTTSFFSPSSTPSNFTSITPVDSEEFIVPERKLKGKPISHKVTTSTPQIIAQERKMVGGYEQLDTPEQPYVELVVNYRSRSNLESLGIVGMDDALCGEEEEDYVLGLGGEGVSGEEQEDLEPLKEMTKEELMRQLMEARRELTKGIKREPREDWEDFSADGRVGRKKQRFKVGRDVVDLTDF